MSWVRCVSPYLVFILVLLETTSGAFALGNRLVARQSLRIRPISFGYCSQNKDKHDSRVRLWSRDDGQSTSTVEAPQSRLEESGVSLVNTGEDIALNTKEKIPGLGLAVLCTVPLVWGTYVPIVRLLYEIDPPIPGFLFSAFYFFISSVTTTALSRILDERQKTKSALTKQSINTPEQERIRALAGWELGSWLFMGNTLQLLGLKTVPSDRAGFLVQLTTILVPLVSATLAGDLFAVDVTTWIACLVALSGIVVMNVDFSNLTTGTSSIGISTGDGLILSSALMYTMHVIRLGRWAPSVPPLKLAASKSTVETILSVVLVASSVTVASMQGANTVDGNFFVEFLQGSGKELVTFFDTVSEQIAAGTLSMDSVAKAIGATLWAGWIVTAYVIFAQSFGQQRVGASEANLIYSLQPIFTASFAYILLGETMDTSGFVGGGLILAAVVLVASNQPQEQTMD